MDLQAPVDYTEKCTVADTAEVEASITPPKAMAEGVYANGMPKLPQTPPPITDGVCNDYLPNDSSYNRYIWVVRCSSNPISFTTCSAPFAYIPQMLLMRDHAHEVTSNY